MIKEGDHCVIMLKSKDDVKSAVNLLKSISKEKVHESYDVAVYERILEKVRKNPQAPIKKAKVGPNPPPFMCLGAELDPFSIEQPERKLRFSVFAAESTNLELKEELSENVQARQRIYSEQVQQVSEPGQPTQAVGYQSSKFTLNRLV